MPRRITILSDATSPVHHEDGLVTTQNGIDWSERCLDEEYVRGLRGDYDECEPDYDDYDDRDYDDDDESDEEE